MLWYFYHTKWVTIYQNLGLLVKSAHFSYILDKLSLILHTGVFIKKYWISKDSNLQHQGKFFREWA